MAGNRPSPSGLRMSARKTVPSRILAGTLVSNRSEYSGRSCGAAQARPLRQTDVTMKTNGVTTQFLMFMAFMLSAFDKTQSSFRAGLRGGCGEGGAGRGLPAVGESAR